VQAAQSVDQQWTVLMRSKSQSIRLLQLPFFWIDSLTLFAPLESSTAAAAAATTSATAATFAIDTIPKGSMKERRKGSTHHGDN
jgi:hypothetical protein